MSNEEGSVSLLETWTDALYVSAVVLISSVVPAEGSLVQVNTRTKKMIM